MMNAQNISVDPSKTPVDLVQNILINSSCIDVQSVSASGDPRPGQTSYASFNASGTNFPFPSGIVLTTSPSINAQGPYDQSTSIGVRVANWDGDPDLNRAIGINNSTQATVLEFDFIPSSNMISFNYIFASNEYQLYFPCNFSDSFAFLIKEAGSTEDYKNLAVIPNTTTPVSATTVHPRINPSVTDGNSHNGCNAANETYFNGYNLPSSPIDYAGQTTVMTAQTEVIPNRKYHLKLVVADDESRQYNSAVFLEAGSFISKINFGEDKTIANNNAICFGQNYVLDTNLDPAVFTFTWFKKDNTGNYMQIPGASGATYSVSSTGSYRVEAFRSSLNCLASGEITVDFTPEIVTANTSLLQCDDNNGGISIFNLTKVNTIVNNDPQNTIEGFYETLANADAAANAILNPENYVNKSPNQIVFARIENASGCYNTAQVTLGITTTTIPPQAPIAKCDGDAVQDGLYEFDLNSEVTPQILTGLPSGLVVNYYLTGNDALLMVNQLPNIFKNTAASSQTIYARVQNGADCYDITPIELRVNTFDPPKFEDESEFLCKGEEIVLSVAAGFSGYSWSAGGNSNTLTVTAPGDYSVTVTDSNGCTKTKKFTVLLSEPATITGAVVKDFSATDNSILIQYTGVGDYEFSINGSDFQNSPSFQNVVPGIYYASAQDKNGCGISNIFKIYVLDYPRFFTPNGDGQNDLWIIKNIDQMPDYTISIFDRYGKLLKQMNQNNSGWNGIFNNQQMPSDDYWFTLLFADGKNVKGHFSLAR
ncbi:T9SS type B sorting domain-containing protein [Flavobacterium hungaricum]|nr:choice-of-anchor L domain-containing protein [Flavobacterium hungaricum]